MPEFGATILDNVSNLPIEPVSLVTVSTPYISFWIFALSFTPNPFQTFWLHSFEIVCEACSISSKVMDVSQIWILHMAAKSRVRLFSIFWKLGRFFSASNFLQINGWELSKVQLVGLSRHKTRTVSVCLTQKVWLLKKARTKVPEWVKTFVFQKSPWCLNLGSPC